MREELISKEALKIAVLDTDWNDDTDEDVALDMIDEAPTVEERKHGHWIEDEQGDIKCSNCDRYLYPMGIRTIYISDICRKLKTNFCPECGVIMDGGSNDD